MDLYKKPVKGHITLGEGSGIPGLETFRRVLGSLAFRRALDEPFSTWGMGKDAPLPHRGTMAVSGDISGYGSWG